MSFLKQALRKAGQSVEIETVSLKEIVQEINPTDVRVVGFQGTRYLHLVDANDDYLSIKVGSKAEMDETNDESMILSLLRDNVVYTGETENGRWFTFGRKADLEPTKTISFASLMKKGGLKALVA